MSYPLCEREPIVVSMHASDGRCLRSVQTACLPRTASEPTWTGQRASLHVQWIIDAGGNGDERPLPAPSCVGCRSGDKAFHAKPERVVYKRTSWRVRYCFKRTHAQRHTNKET